MKRFFVLMLNLSIILSATVSITASSDVHTIFDCETVTGCTTNADDGCILIGAVAKSEQLEHPIPVEGKRSFCIATDTGNATLYYSSVGHTNQTGLVNINQYDFVELDIYSSQDIVFDWSLALCSNQTDDDASWELQRAYLPKTVWTHVKMSVSEFSSERDSEVNLADITKFKMGFNNILDKSMSYIPKELYLYIDNLVVTKDGVGLDNELFDYESYINGGVVPKEDTVKPTASIITTNNTAQRQTVTLCMWDNKGIAGYYWGTQGTYSNNTYIPNVWSTVTKEITLDGKYFLTVKDIYGNCSDTVSIQFLTVYLDANGGSVDLSYILIAKGNTATLPVIDRMGYRFKGWSSNIEDETGVGEVTPKNNMMLYAIWETKKGVIYGDIDFDNKTTSLDALYCLQYSVCKISLTPEQQKYGDVNNDGSVTALDALLILQKSVNKINRFPIENTELSA